MRIHIACLSLILLSFGGCNPVEQARQKDVQRNLKQIEQTLENYHESHEGTGTQSSPVTASKPESNTFTGKVIAVKDGDSIVVLRDKQQIEIRLKDVDCPELAQPFGRQAKRQTSELCFGKTVTVKATGKDRYDRTLAHIDLPDGNELNRELVRRGYAWWYREYSKDETLGQLEADAREKKLGLWAAAKPIPPWDWRAAKRGQSDVLPSDFKVMANGVVIVAVLPNPEGPDAGNEQVTIGNSMKAPVDLDGWKLIDKAGNVFLLENSVQPGKTLVVTMTEATMPLNNNGDTVILIDADGVGRSRISYLEAQVKAGVVLRFGR
jgi:endonuclease YncB( thermonuclease family)